MSYYNTVGLSGDDLKEAVKKAASQEQAIYLIYEHGKGAYGPSQIMHLCLKAGYRWPIGSVRRALTVLTKQGKLVKLPKKVQGMYGKLEHQWAAA